MSDDLRTLVVVDPLTAEEAVALGEVVERWLVEHGLAVREGDELRPGPGAVAAVEDDDPSWVELLFSNVVIDTSWGAHDAAANLEGPACPVCGEEYDLDAFLELVGAWHASRAEPVLRCATGDFSGRAGDWPLVHAVAVGHLAVELQNWPELLPAWRSQLEEVVGRRAVWVEAHV